MAAAPTNEVVVWEWMNELQCWYPYDAPVSRFIEERHKKGQSSHRDGGATASAAVPSFNLGQIDRHVKAYDIDLQNNVQIRKNTGMQRPIRRSLYPGDSMVVSGILWEWSGDYKGQWCSYNASAAKVLEDAYSQKAQSVDLQTVGLPYVVDLSKNTQTKTTTGFIRKVRRTLGMNHTNMAPLDLSTPTSQNSRLAPGAAAAAADSNSSLTSVTSNSSQTVESKPAAVKAVKFTCCADLHLVAQFVMKVVDPPKKEDCCICLEELTDGSGYDPQDKNVVLLTQCKHMFHQPCLAQLYKTGSKDGALQCPSCKAIHGVKKGICPAGQMEYERLGQALPSYPGNKTIRIRYNISSGTQGPQHPHPGKPYHCQGFPRTAYLPDNEQGNKVLRLLIRAWERRLTFTVATSVTTGQGDCVVWNEIHHKTELGSNSGHGFPDPKYLDNVLNELAAQGVYEEGEAATRAGAGAGAAIPGSGQ